MKYLAVSVLLVLVPVVPVHAGPIEGLFDKPGEVAEVDIRAAVCPKPGVETSSIVDWRHARPCFVANGGDRFKIAGPVVQMKTGGYLPVLVSGKRYFLEVENVTISR